MELRYLRDTDKRKIDFVVIQKKPIFAVECKLSEKNISPHIKYFSDRITIPMFYQVYTVEFQRQISERISLLPFIEFCQTEKIV